MPRRTSQVSERKRLANQRNAKKSTGPRTPAGKKRSSMNAVTHGLFCQEVCVLKEERPLFIELRREFIRDLKPQRLLELSLVDKMIDCQWRLRRLRITESTVYEGELREHLKEEGESFVEEMRRNDQPDYCAMQAMMGLMRDGKLEKYSRLEQRWQNMFHRCLKELREVRKDRAVIDALPESPFEKTVDDVKYGLEDGKTFEEVYMPKEEKSEQKEPELEEEIEVEDESAERSQLDSDASPSPQPSPLQGEGVTAQASTTCAADVPAKIQNEATVVPTPVTVRPCRPNGPFLRPPTWR